jgi:hypothetical protein
MILIKNRKGFLFTIATIILIIPLIYLVSFYGGVSETPMDDAIGGIRCNELHYYVEDVERDMERAVVIFGRRAARNAVELVTATPPNPLRDYIFNCTPQCDVDCSRFIRPEKGAEAAIAELVVCGTLYGENITDMQNNTLPEWIGGIEVVGGLMGFNVNITPYEIKIVHRDAWNFAIIIKNRVKISDREGLCFYRDDTMVAISNSSIVGLDDPLYYLENGGAEIKSILPCENPALPRTKAGCGVSGSGAGGGSAVFYTDVGGALSDYGEYCNGSSSVLPPTGDTLEQVFVVNDVIGSLCNPGMRDCFNVSMPRHFNGVVFYDNTASMSCNATIPWIAGTGDLDDKLPVGHGGLPDPDCNDTRIEDGDCLLVLNIPPPCSNLPSLHYVLLGCNRSYINASCYYISDIEEEYNPECSSGEGYSNGPCFLDRLEGNLNLSPGYVEQANETFGTTRIGMESILSIYHQHYMEVWGYNVSVNPASTAVDYLYWQNVSGCYVSGYCDSSNYSPRLDCPHSYKYRLDTSCEEVTECPVCGDGFCDLLEDCVSCGMDCRCPGCPVYANLTICSECVPLPSNCDVTFNLSILDQTGSLMNLSSDPWIDVTTQQGAAPPSSSRHQMTLVETGKYYYIEFNVNKNAYINGTIRIREHGCPLLKGATLHNKSQNLPECP